MAVDGSQSEGENITIMWESYGIAFHPAAMAKEPLTKLTIHALSLPNFQSKTRRSANIEKSQTAPKCAEFLESEGWHIAITGHRNTEMQVARLRAGAAFAVTHTIELSRIDGTTFQESESAQIRKALYYFLSFAAGRWIGIGGVVGTYGNEQQVLLAVGFERSSPWSSSFEYYWWDHHYGQSDLPAAFVGFVKLIRNPIWESTITDIIYGYLEANQLDRRIIATDIGIVLAQFSLERLAWTYLCHDRQVETEISFKSMKAADKIRKAITLLRIPTSVSWAPPSPTTLVPPDGPQMITETRNNIAHPKKMPAASVSSQKIWNLAQWYIESMILSLSDYNGRANNRALPKTWRTAPEFVPWALTTP
jgi:hypothetical protein